LKLTEVVGALGRAKVVLTLDNGIMHLAGATQTPVIALFRDGIHRLWTPPSGNIVPIVSEPGRPVSEIHPDKVWRALKSAV
jgi:ADP-heptose:LPS heptosyltransferase